MSFPGTDNTPNAGSPDGSAAAAGSALDTILMVSGGYCVSRALHAVADLGIADALGDEPLPVDALADATGTHADTLGRVLRLLSSHGVFDARGELVSHNPVSRLLRSDHPQSARALARMFGLPFFWKTFEVLPHTLRHGEPAAVEAYPEGLWGWLGSHGDAASVFDEAMRGKSFAQVASVVQAYDFSRFASIADIGGGRGHLLQAILERSPGAKGVLFDQPHVIEQAGSIASDRLALVAGDFFKDDLPASDGYVLMEVIHDWNDEQSLQILSAVFRAAPTGATVLLVEQLMPDGAGPHWVKMLDLHMLALFGAKQRNLDEYQRLLRAAGFEPTGVTETFSGAAIVEARKR